MAAFPTSLSDLLSTRATSSRSEESSASRKSTSRVCSHTARPSAAADVDVIVFEDAREAASRTVLSTTNGSPPFSGSPPAWETKTLRRHLGPNWSAPAPPSAPAATGSTSSASSSTRPIPSSRTTESGRRPPHFKRPMVSGPRSTRPTQCSVSRPTPASATDLPRPALSLEKSCTVRRSPSLSGSVPAGSFRRNTRRVNSGRAVSASTASV